MLHACMHAKKPASVHNASKQEPGEADTGCTFKCIKHACNKQSSSDCVSVAKANLLGTKCQQMQLECHTGVHTHKLLCQDARQQTCQQVQEPTYSKYNLNATQGRMHTRMECDDTNSDTKTTSSPSTGLHHQRPLLLLPLGVQRCRCCR
jgi:hypothetical protein